MLGPHVTRFKYGVAMDMMLGVGLFTGISGLVVALLGGYTFLTKRLGGGLMVVAGVAVATFVGFTIVVDPLDVFSLPTGDRR